MKKIFLAFATVLGLALYVTSCTDACKDVDCGVHGTCNDGTCDCAAGYELDTNGRCDLVTSSKYVGDFNAAEFDQVTGKAIQVKDATGKTVELKYAPSIKAITSDINKVTVVNLGDYLCTKNGKDTFVEIPATVSKDTLKFDFTDCNNRFVGKGILSTDKKTITFTYSNTYPPDPAKPGTVITDKNKSVWTKK